MVEEMILLVEAKPDAEIDVGTQHENDEKVYFLPQACRGKHMSKSIL